MAHNKIESSSGSIHLRPLPESFHEQSGRYACGARVEGDMVETDEPIDCLSCQATMMMQQAQAEWLDKAITFGRMEALFEGDIATRAGSPSAWAKLNRYEIEFAYNMAADLLRVAVANDLPLETVIRAACRKEALRLELNTFGVFYPRGNR